MSMYEQGGYALPTEVAARKARVARMTRWVLAVPFWGLLALTIVSWPVGTVVPNAGWNAAKFLSPILLVPIVLIRAILTTRVLGFSRHRIAPVDGPPGCVVGFGLLAGVMCLAGAANFLAPALAPTTQANAMVTKCHPSSDGDTVVCIGNWTVNGIRETGRTLPVSARPGSTVPIMVSQVAADVAYAPLSDSRRALGAGSGVLGVAVTGASLFGLIRSGLRIRRGLDDVIAGRAAVPAQVLRIRPRQS